MELMWMHAAAPSFFYIITSQQLLELVFVFCLVANLFVYAFGSCIHATRRLSSFV